MSPCLPTPTQRNYTARELAYRGPAMAQLSILRQQMKLGGLKTGSRRIKLDDGAEIFCHICFNSEVVQVTLPHTRTNEDIKQEKQLSGFFCYPHAGAMGEFLTVSLGVANRILYVNGTGFDDLLNHIEGVPAVYPLIDNDHGTWVTNRSSGEWVIEYCDPTTENYGNTDWRHGELGIITYYGPPSRYWCSGLSDEFTGLNNFGSKIYQRGAVIGTAPAINYPGFGTALVPYVLGAALYQAADKSVWKVAVIQGWAIEDTGLDFVPRTKFIVAVQSIGSTAAAWESEHTPDGWHIIYQQQDFAIQSPVFFSESATKAVTITGYIRHDIEINYELVDGGLSSTCTITPSIVSTAGHGSASFDQVSYQDYNTTPYDPPFPPGGYGAVGSGEVVHRLDAEEVITGSRVVAADFVGDEIRYLTVSYDQKTVADDDHVYTSSYDGAGTFSYQSDAKNRRHHTINATVSIDGGTSASIYREYELTVEGTEAAGTHNNNSVYADMWILSGIKEQQFDTFSAGVVFADIRHNILVLAARDSKHHVIDPGVLSINTGSGWTDSESQTASTQTDSYEKELFISGKINQSLPLQDSLLKAAAYSDTSISFYHIDSPAPPIYTNPSFDVPALQIPFWYANIPCGSWAVSAFGDHFYSMVADNVVFNFIDVGNADGLLQVDEQNLVYYPIAPV